MQNPTPPRRLWLWLAAASLSLSSCLAFAEGPVSSPEAKASCSGQYKPEYKKLWNLDKSGWDDFCRTPVQKSGGAHPAKVLQRNEASSRVEASSLDARQALDTGDFNKLYDKFAGGKDAGGTTAVLAPPPSKAIPLKPAAVGAAKDKVTVPQTEPRIDPKEVSDHFKYSAPDSSISDWPGPLGWLGGLVDHGIVKPIREAFFANDEKAYIKSVTDELQHSEEGRKIMRGIVSEGITVAIQPTAFPGSPVVKKGDLEEITGTRGEAIPEERIYRFNSNFIKMQDKEVALESVASNMGHELNHILLHARIDKNFKKEDYGEVLDFALVDEQSARLKGYVVAYELNKGKPNGYIQEARGLLNNPDAYWESMKLWMPAYARTLDLDEMKDPVRAYQARLQALTDKRDELEEEGPDLAFDLRRIDHMGSAHGLAAQLTELRSLFASDQKTLPTRMADVKESIDVVKERISFLQTKEGKPLAEKLKAAANDPKFVKLFGDMQGDLKKLEGYKDSKPVPEPKPTPGQMGWKAFEKRWNELHEDAPKQDPPWKEKKK